MEKIQTKWGTRSQQGLRSEGDPGLERLNPFERKQRLDAARASAATTEDDSPQARQKRFEDRHAAWVSPGRAAVTTSGGTVLDAETARAKAASDASRAAAKQPAPVPVNHGLTLEKDWQSILALLETFLAQQNLFYPSERNQDCFYNAMRTAVDQQKARWTLVDMERVAQRLLEPNYFESPTRRRGDPAPLFFEYEPPAPAPEPEPTHRINSPVKKVAADPVAEAEARNMPLNQLAKKVKAGYARLQRDGSYRR